MIVIAMLLIMFGFDLFLPFQFRSAGVGPMPWGEEASVRSFKRSYGMIKFPRTLLLFGPPLVLLWNRYFGLSDDAAAWLTVLTLGVWISAVVFDLIVACRVAIKVHDGQ
jgi:hypothetical protein